MLPLGDPGGMFGTSDAGTTIPTDPVSTVYDDTVPAFTEASTLSVLVRLEKFGEPTQGTA